MIEQKHFDLSSVIRVDDTCPCVYEMLDRQARAWGYSPICRQVNQQVRILIETGEWATHSTRHQRQC